MTKTKHIKQKKNKKTKKQKKWEKFVKTDRWFCSVKVPFKPLTRYVNLYYMRKYVLVIVNFIRYVRLSDQIFRVGLKIDSKACRGYFKERSFFWRWLSLLS